MIRNGPKDVELPLSVRFHDALQRVESQNVSPALARVVLEFDDILLLRGPAAHAGYRGHGDLKAA